MEKVKQRTTVKSLIQFINEARKFPHLNPKVPVNQEIKDHLDSARNLPNTKLKNSFASFTSVDKLGINPGSTYDTPLGIYSYPSQYIYEMTGKKSSMKELPFAGESPYVNIFSVRGNILDVSEMKKSDAKKYYDKIINIYLDAVGTPKGNDRYYQNMTYIKGIIDNASSGAKFWEYLGGQFWYVTMEVSKLLMEKSRKWGRSQHSVAWNKLFREIGIDGCIDRGIGIIHTAEPTQAVFFSKSVIKKNKRVYNKYSPEYVSSREEEGELIRVSSDKSDPMIWKKEFGDWNGATWYGGIWKDGRWVSGRWKGGRWERGTWKSGTWERGRWKKGTWEHGVWMNGTWEKGTWESGFWENGTWKYGTWEKGTWEDGTWEMGTWRNGTWLGGRWKEGIWHFGIWEGGTWERGTWENGIWKDGVWLDGLFRDGTWENGRWLGGTWGHGGTWLGGKWFGGYDMYGNYHPEGDSPDKW